MRPSEAREFVIDVRNNYIEHMTTGFCFDEEEWATIKAMYDATISYVDHLIGDLFEFISLELDDTVFVVTADHGELFGEHGLLAHRLVLDDAVTNFSLVVHDPTDITDYNGELIQHIDLMKTLLAEVGAEHPTLQGYDFTQDKRPYCIIQRGEARAGATLTR